MAAEILVKVSVVCKVKSKGSGNALLDLKLTSEVDEVFLLVYIQQTWMAFWMLGDTPYRNF